MRLNIAKEIADMERMTVKELRYKHIDAFGEATRSGNKDYLVKRIAWRLQANAHGDLTSRARQRAEELANDADLRSTAPKVKTTDTPRAVTRELPVDFGHDSRLPMVGSNIKRHYKGRDIVVRVLPKGFEYEGEVYRSLSAVAKVVTGTHWNGYHFFNLKRNGGDDE